MKTIIAVLDKQGESVTGTVVNALKALPTEHTDSFGIATPTTCIMREDVDALQKISAPIAVGYTFSKILSTDDPKSTILENATLVFEGRIYKPLQKRSATEIVAKKLERNHDKAIEALFEEIEGDFSFIITEPQRLIAGRDPVGVQPLYYGENRNVAALAASRTALRNLGIEKPKSFPPGHLAFVSRNGFKFKPIKTLTYSKPKPMTMQMATETLCELLEDSVRRRVSGLKEIAVAFSGGLDSSVIAILAKKCRVSVNLIHVSLENRPETEGAKRAADELKLPLQVYLFREGDVEEVVSKVVKLVEEPNPVKTAIGLPFYWTAEKTAEAGLKVLLAGQGADELFGGYQRYIDDYSLRGAENVMKKMFEDAIKLHENNIERDKKICGFHNVELRLPFASYQIAEFALSLPLELKFERKGDSLRKLVLRKVAENLGLSKEIAEKPKKAIQYATGINDALEKIAKKHRTTVSEHLNGLFLEHFNSD